MFLFHWICTFLVCVRAMFQWLRLLGSFPSLHLPFPFAFDRVPFAAVCTYFCVFVTIRFHPPQRILVVAYSLQIGAARVLMPIQMWLCSHSPKEEKTAKKRNTEKQQQNEQQQQQIYIKYWLTIESNLFFFWDFHFQCVVYIVVIQTVLSCVLFYLPSNDFFFSFSFSIPLSPFGAESNAMAFYSHNCIPRHK